MTIFFEGEDSNVHWPSEVDFKDMRKWVNQSVNGMVVSEIEVSRIGPMHSSMTFRLNQKGKRKPGTGVAFLIEGGFEVQEANSTTKFKFGIGDTTSFEFMGEENGVAAYFASMRSGVRTMVRLMQ